MFCQNIPSLEFLIKKDESCTQVLETFKLKFDVLVAYSPTLIQTKANTDKKLEANDIISLFEKICYSFQLEFVTSGENSFLVRSEARDIQNSDDIILHVRLEDQKEKIPVAFASVFDESRQFFAFTDEHGDCFIRLPKSKKGEKLNIHSLAYQNSHFIIDTENTYQKIAIQQVPVKVIPITINTIKKRLSFVRQNGVSMDNFLIDKISGSSVFQKDIMRTLQILPGVSAINDSKSSIRIRGANEEATLLMLDNMPIYKADHFYGIFGAFNAWYVNKITLFKNNLPSEYGGRTSGMVKMESDPAIKKFALNLDFNLLNSGIMADIPLGEYVSIKLSGRKTYTNILNSGLYDLSQRENLEFESKPKNAKNLIVSKPEFDFYDANARIVFNKGNHRLDANFFESGDHFIDKYNISFRNKQLMVNEELFKQVSDWNNSTTGINYQYTDNDYDFLSTFYRTSFGTTYNISSNLTRMDSTGPIKDTVTIFNTNNILDYGIKISVRNKLYHDFTIGFEHIHHRNELYIENDKNPIFEINKAGSETSLFSQITLGSKSGFYFQPALRTTMLHDPGDIYFLPQIYVSYVFQNNLTLKSSAGKQVQFVRSIEHENALGQKQQFFALSNKSNVPVGIGVNYMAGIWKSFGDLTLDIETYYRHLDGSLIHATQTPGLRPVQPAVGSTSFRLFSGDSRSYGTDFSLAYEKKSFFSMLTYTLSKTENRFSRIFKNQYFPSSEDSRHQLKWVNTLTLKKIDFSASYIGATGRPYVDLSSVNTPADRNNIIISDYIKNLPAYHRLDLGVHYRFKLFETESRLGVSIFNVTNRTNIKYRQFVFQLPPSSGSTGQNPINTILGSDVSQLDRTINLSFNLSIK